MKYQHIVKHNGVWYQAGEEVPSDTAPVSVEEPKEEVHGEVPDVDIPEEPEPVRRKSGRPRTHKD